MVGLVADGLSSFDLVPTEVTGTCRKVLWEHQIICHSLTLLFQCSSDGPEGSQGLVSLFLLPLEAKVRVLVDPPTKLEEREKLSFQMEVGPMVRDHMGSALCQMLCLEHQVHKDLFLKVQI